MFKQIINMPNFINHSDVSSWFSKFVTFFNKMTGGNFTTNEITLEFSDLKPISNYYSQSISLQEVKDKLKKLLGKRCEHNERAYDLIDEARDVEHLREMASWLAEQMMSNDDDYRENKEKILEIIKEGEDYTDSPNIVYTAGKYIDQERKIILYNPVIEDMAEHNHISLHSCYEGVLAHELFHAGHYEESRKNYIHKSFFFVELEDRHDYTSKVIKESLAAYFENQYYLEYGISCNLSGDWYIDILKSPYSGAKNIIDDINFRRIFNRSLYDVDAALRELYSDDYTDFYRIKNAVYIEKVEKIKTKPVFVNVQQTPIISEKPYTKRYKTPVYLLPSDENEFLNNIRNYGCYSLIFVLKDGTMQSYTCKSKNIFDAKDLKSNIKTQSIMRADKNLKALDAQYILVVCGKYNY